jgi:hypothetical protein
VGTSILYRAAVLSTLLLVAACGGGGDDGGPVTVAETTVSSGQITNGQNSGAAVRANASSLAYTNTRGAAVKVTIETVGSLTQAGTAVGFASHEYEIDGGLPVAERTAAVSGSTVSAAKQAVVTLPAGATIGVSVAVGFESPTGPVTVSWSGLHTRLTVTP